MNHALILVFPKISFPGCEHVCILKLQLMKKDKTITLAARGFILLSAFSLLSVSLMAFFAPQSVMDLVQVRLENSDAFSSIRGVYGGVGLTIFIFLIIQHECKLSIQVVQKINSMIFI